MMKTSLNKEQLERLAIHCRGLPEYIIRQVSHEGAVVVRDEKDRSGEDPIATHHLIEWTLSCHGDPLKGLRKKALTWYSKNHGLPHDPFALDSFLSSGVCNEAFQQIGAQIAASQLPSGLVSFYTGYLHGGDHFATLWGIKILSYLSPDFDTTIRHAIVGLVASTDYLAKNASHLGFLYWVLHTLPCSLQQGPEVLTTLEARLLANQNEDGLWDGDPTTTAFVCYDLLDQEKPSDMAVEAAGKALTTLFSLDTPADSVPPRLAEYQKRACDSLFLQMLLRAVIAGNRMLQYHGWPDPGESLGDHLVGSASTLIRAVNELVDRTKLLELELEKLRRIPTQYREATDRFLAESPFAQNVLIMMTFGFDHRQHGHMYSSIFSTIQKTLAERGLKGFITTTRQYHPELYGNLQIYLNACCAGVAVFDNLIPEKQHNPNVAMEAGQMMAQGKPVAILKDESLPTLPADWAGRLYCPFASHTAASIVEPLRKWLRDNSLGEGGAEDGRR